MDDRGEHRAIYTVLLNTIEFTQLSPAAQLVWFHLKLMLGATGIDVVPAAEAQLSDTTNLSIEDVGRALGELQNPLPDGMGNAIGNGIPDGIGNGIGNAIPDGGSARSEGHGGPWVIRQGSVIWLRNGLAFEPSRSLDNANHRKSVMRHIAWLPKLPVVNDFADYYGLDRPFPGLPDRRGSPMPSPMPSARASGMAYPITENGERRTEDGKRSNSGVAARTRTRARGEPGTDAPEPPPEPDRFDAWMGTEVQRLGRIDPMTRLSLVGLYGPNGTDERVWQDVPETDRPQLLATAMLRWQSENHRAFNARLFRAILKAVIADGEGEDPDQPDEEPLTDAQHKLYLEIREALEDCGMDPEEAAAEAMSQARDAPVAP